MDTQRLNEALVKWLNSEEPTLPEFNSVGELAYFIVRAYSTLDQTEFGILIEDLQNEPI